MLGILGPLNLGCMRSSVRRSTSAPPPQFAVPDPPLAAGAISKPSVPQRQRPWWAAETPTVKRFHDDTPLSQHRRPPYYVQVRALPFSDWAKTNWPGLRVACFNIHGTLEDVQNCISCEMDRWGVDDFSFDSWYERRRYED